MPEEYPRPPATEVVDSETGEIIESFNESFTAYTELPEETTGAGLGLAVPDLEIPPLVHYEPSNVKFPRKVGRRNKLTKNTIREFEKYLIMGNYVDVACDIVGISRQTYYRWMAEGEEIFELFEELPEDVLLDTPQQREAAMSLIGRESYEILYYDFYRMSRNSQGQAEARLAAIVFKSAPADAYLAKATLESRYSHHWGKKRIDLDVKDERAEKEKSGRTMGDMSQTEQADEIARLLYKAQVKKLNAGE